MEHGFGFSFLIEYEDEMKKNTGHRWTETDDFFFFLFFWLFRFVFVFHLSKKEPLFEEIFSKYL